MSREHAGYEALARTGASTFPESQPPQQVASWVPLTIFGGIFALIGASMYLEATGKIQRQPVYYPPYDPYYRPHSRGPGLYLAL